MHAMLENTASGADTHEGGYQEQTPFTLWKEEHKLNDNVINILHENDVTSLNDLKLFDDDEEVKEFVNSLGIKKFIVKKKLINAIKALKNKTKPKKEFDNELNVSHNDLGMYNSNSINQQSFGNNDNTKITKGKIIYWESVKNVMTTNDIIQIKSNKAQNIEMKTTNEKTKKQLIKNEKIDETGYFEAVKHVIKKGFWDQGVGGKIVAVPMTIAAGVYTIVPLLPALYYPARYLLNKPIKKQLKSKDNYNTQSKIFNDKLKQTKQLEKHILLKFSKLEKQEKKLNSYNFAMERFYNLNNKSKIIMVIGPTGFGKSLVANRLLGNKEDIDNISESKECEFKVAMTGNTNSVTNTLNKKSKIVNIINGKEEKEKEKEESYILSVIDTPGAFDSNGCDN
eukprot:89447_1